MSEQGHYKHWQLSCDAHDVLWVGFDKSGSSVNTLDAETLGEFGDILGIIAHHGVYRGVVIYSLKKSGFIAGADITQFTQLRSPSEAFEAIRTGQSLLQRLADLKIPTVSLIEGFCLGGGLELALACRYRLVVDEPTTRLGLPEVSLGIHPGWGGTVRLPRLISAPSALNLIVSGQLLAAAQATRLGIADFCVPKRHARTAAVDLILGTVKVRRRRQIWSKLTNSSLCRPLIAALVKKQLAHKLIAQHYPAPFAALETWRCHGVRQAAFSNEAQSVARLLFSASGQQLIRCFHLREQLKSLTKTSTQPIKHVHVIGAGIMGGDIAAWCAFKGFKVTLQDRQPEYIAPAIARAYAFYQKKLKNPRLVQEVMDRLVPDQAGYGIAKADLIIEAIFEDVTAKQELFKEIDAKANRQALLATNTSSIPLDEIACVLQNPARLVGIHFFNPVAKMQLVEIVCGEQSSETAINSALAFVARLDRLPLPVKSRPGFLVNRILMPYLLEAVQLLEEGIPAAVIDKAALEFGMPMGPVELADTVGLDVCLSVAKKLADSLGYALPEHLAAKVSTGQLGKKTGQGFYRYHKDGTKIGAAVKTGFARQAEMTDRLLLTLLNEAVRCLRENIVADEDLLDAGMIFGAGFAPFRGGPIQYAHDRGCQAIVATLRALQAQYGERFKPDVYWQTLLRDVPASTKGFIADEKTTAADVA